MMLLHPTHKCWLLLMVLQDLLRHFLGHQIWLYVSSFLPVCIIPNSLLLAYVSERYNMCSTLPLNLELLSSAIFHKLSFLVCYPTHGWESKESKELSWSPHLSSPKVSSAREVGGELNRDFSSRGFSMGPRCWLSLLAKKFRVRGQVMRPVGSPSAQREHIHY